MKEYKYITRCDFGEGYCREDVLSRHGTLKSAISQYGRLWKIYHRIHKWKVWLEEVTDKDLLKLINRTDFFKTGKCYIKN